MAGGATMVVLCIIALSGPGRAQEASATARAIKSPPQLLSEPDLSIPQEARVLGHHGTVVLRGTVGVDGAISDIVVHESSWSDLLDKAAIAQAASWRFTPAIDADGRPTPWTGNLPVNYDMASGGGLWTYSCEQLVRDSDWSDATFGREFRSKRRAYLMLSGLTFAATYRSGAKASPPFEQLWQKTIDGCRARPKSKMMDVFRKQQ
ncbi:energy transducer TonB [Sphingomonas sp.]|uniref:energy transducer TonB n=1 Tax=Sphingomonas sp. TaxID=28214 RepID=UPI003F70577C